MLIIIAPGISVEAVPAKSDEGEPRAYLDIVANGVVASVILNPTQIDLLIEVLKSCK